MYTYYLTQRPADIGTFPKDNVIMVECFDFKKHCDEIGRAAWAKVAYAEPLSDKQVSDYELTPANASKLGRKMFLVYEYDDGYCDICVCETEEEAKNQVKRLYEMKDPEFYWIDYGYEEIDEEDL